MVVEKRADLTSLDCDIYLSAGAKQEHYAHGKQTACTVTLVTKLTEAT